MFFIDFNRGHVSKRQESDKQTLISDTSQILSCLYDETVLAVPLAPAAYLFLYRKKDGWPESAFFVTIPISSFSELCLSEQFVSYVQRRCNALRTRIHEYFSFGVCHLSLDDHMQRQELRGTIADVLKTVDDVLSNVPLLINRAAIQLYGIDVKTFDDIENFDEFTHAHIVSSDLRSHFLPNLPAMKALSFLTVVFPDNATENVDLFSRVAKQNLRNLSNLTIYNVGKQRHLNSIADWIGGSVVEDLNVIGIYSISLLQYDADAASSISYFARDGVAQNTSLRRLRLCDFDFSHEDSSGVSWLALSLANKNLEHLNLKVRFPDESATAKMFCDIVRQSDTLTSLVVPTYFVVLLDAFRNTSIVMPTIFSTHLDTFEKAFMYNISLRDAIVPAKLHRITHFATTRNTQFLTPSNTNRLLVDFVIGMAQVYGRGTQFPPYLLLEIFGWIGSRCCCWRRCVDSDGVTNKERIKGEKRAIDEKGCPMSKYAVMYRLDARKNIARILSVQESIRKTIVNFEY